MTLPEIQPRLYEGCIALRDSWGGDGSYIFIRSAVTVAPNIIENIMTMPTIVKEHLIKKGQPIKFGSHICLYDGKSEVLVGWIPSQQDMLANDWNVINKIV
jgi:hypothetical protein